MKLSSLLFVSIVAVSSVPVAAAPEYALVKSVPLGAPDRWDYVVYDPQTNRVFVAHSDKLDVIDAASGSVAGEVKGISGGTHGTAVSLATAQGFTDDGRSGKAVAFDLHTFQVKREIPADVDADAITLDPLSGHIFIIDGDSAAITVIDPKTDAQIATIKTGEKLEYAVPDGHGSIYVAGNGAKDVLKIDARSNKVSARWPTPFCTSPHGIAVDTRAHRVFMGCLNNLMMVVDTNSGQTVAKLQIGRGSDAVAFDPVRRRVFSSNGRDGTITAYQQIAPDRYEPLSVIQTTISARTMDVDPKSGRLFVAGADTSPSGTPEGRPSVKPGTLRLMIFEPKA